MDYVYFTDDQKQRANSVDLVDFLERQGEKLVRSGHEWRWKRYDSVTVRGNEWFRHSRKEGGHAIDFVQEFYDMSFPESVQWLLGGESGVEVVPGELGLQAEVRGLVALAFDQAGALTAPPGEEW